MPFSYFFFFFFEFFVQVVFHISISYSFISFTNARLFFSSFMHRTFLILDELKLTNSLAKFTIGGQCKE